LVEGMRLFTLRRHKVITMHQFKLTNHCLFRDGLPYRYRTEEQDLRAFLMELLNEFYEGEDYRFKVVDDLGLACLAATSICFYHENQWMAAAPEKRALVFATHCGSQFTDREYQNSLDQRARTSPRIFVQTLPNMAAGQVAACFGLRGEHFVLIQAEQDMSALEEITSLTLTHGGATLCLTGWMEYSDIKELTIEMSVRYAAEKDQPLAASSLQMARS